MFHIKRFVIQKQMLLLLLLEDNSLFVLFTLGTFFFHQSKLGRDIELQNTYTIIFKAPVT